MEDLGFRARGVRLVSAPSLGDQFQIETPLGSLWWVQGFLSLWGGLAFSGGLQACSLGFRSPSDSWHMWEFPKIRGTLFWGPYNKDPTVWGTILESPIFGNSHVF